MSDKMSWDEYRAAHNITDVAGGEAFAAYLHYISDGQWDGQVQQVLPIDHRDHQ